MKGSAVPTCALWQGCWCRSPQSQGSQTASTGQSDSIRASSSSAERAVRQEWFEHSEEFAPRLVEWSAFHFACEWIPHRPRLAGLTRRAPLLGAANA